MQSEEMGNNKKKTGAELRNCETENERMQRQVDKSYSKLVDLQYPSPRSFPTLPTCLPTHSLSHFSHIFCSTSHPLPLAVHYLHFDSNCQKWWNGISNFFAHLVKLSACGWAVPTRIPKGALMRLVVPVVSFELCLILSRVGHITASHHHHHHQLHINVTCTKKCCTQKK